jgi:site-specific recombinase XerD
MAKQSRFHAVLTPGRGWRLNIPAGLSTTGKRQQLFFKTRALAEAEAVRLKGQAKEFGQQARALSPSLAEAAAAAANLLQPWGVGILEAARFYAAARELESASRPLDEAAEEWLLSCEGLRSRTYGSYKGSVKRLKAALGSRTLASLTTADLQAAIAPPGTAGTAAQVHIRSCRAFWRWAAKKGLCKAEVFKVEAPKGSRDKEIEILTPAEARALLTTAAKYFPAAVPLYAVQLFAGVRAQEVARLESEHFTESGIDLPAGVSKKGRRRFIEYGDTLKAWLEKFPFESVANWPRIDAAVRKLAGWDLKSQVVADMVAAGTLQSAPKPFRGVWPQNALRHSHASYSVASGVPLESLLFTFGHAGDSTLLRHHYLGRASKKTALEYFAILPEGTAKIQQLQAV